MDEWNTRTHTDSGLVRRCLESDVGLGEAEQRTLAFLREHVPEGVSPMCGNSICQDRRFLARLMPELEAFFHYRNLDVSTLKELARRWAPDVAAGFSKDSSHQALEDIRDSVEELRHYRRFMGELGGA
jgi:oligoribonuclease